MNENIIKLIDNIETVIKGKREQIELVVTCMLASGHILLEDNPGTGKTVLARTLANNISSTSNNILFKRIQFTPDLLPMDLLGTHIFDNTKNEFLFKKGPLFCNILLADEINRASPKVQSALLECMAENQITIGDETIELEKLFFTIATQNPVETEGTYPLPAAQLDRFFMKISLGYTDKETEKYILNNYNSIKNNLSNSNNSINITEIESAKETADNVFVHPEIINSVANILESTRNNTEILLGASTRSGIAFIKCLKCFAFIKGRDFVIEDDIKKIFHVVLHHRLAFKNKIAEANALENICNNELSRLAKMNINK
jgi:MoxR-like ATPase